MNDLTEFQKGAATIALNNLLFDRHFNICDFDQLAKLIGVEIAKSGFAGQDYHALHGLHCVSWADIPEPLRTQTRQKIVELLGLKSLPMPVEKTGPKITENRANACFAGRCW